ncbi:hypothetical protein [Streptomyces sp. NBC_00842]|uniref:hypothetical protein n=1 Tax=Streptomyces sp. NBC_00842 TaxID=2975848 RepID=UPI0038681E91|nr:hypothetical protein OH821_17035 [Streptomyces sp. NBC_00842]
MKIRAEVAEMLRNGSSNAEIMRTLHVGHKTVAQARQALGFPTPARGGRPLLPIPTLFAARTEPVDGGHLRWTGHVSKGVPVLGRRGNSLSAYRIAFKIRHNRESIGYAKPGCNHPGCVAPDHMQDQPMRDRLNTTFNAIFGGQS